MRGDVLLGQNDEKKRSEAESEYRSAVQLNPRSSEHHLKLALALLKKVSGASLLPRRKWIGISIVIRRENPEDVWDSCLPDLHRHRPGGNHSPADPGRQPAAIGCGSTEERAHDLDGGQREGLTSGQLTRAMRRGSVKYVMSLARPRQAKGLLAQVCGVVTMLALVVAPACAPLCAAKVCSRALASTEDVSPCHLMGIAPGSATHVHGAQSCGAPELPAAALNSADKNESQQKDRFEVFGAGLDIPPQVVFPASGQPKDHCFAWTSSPQRISSLSPASVLRI